MTRSRQVDEYLEKYSVAPSPSRDYYGIKVVQDQIILYTWKISHGPHTSPIVRVSRFQDFGKEKTMHNEIERVFGVPMLRHVQSIAEGKIATLLTLPKYLVKKLATYLTFKEVLKISTLSRIAKEVFDGDIVWELLYKRKKMGLVYKDEIEQGSSCGWKRLFKEREMHKPARNRKVAEMICSKHDLCISKVRPSLCLQKKELPRDQPLVTSRSSTKLTTGPLSSLPLKNQRGIPLTPKSVGSLGSRNFVERFRKNPGTEIKGCKSISKKNFQVEVKTPGEPDAKDSSIIFESRAAGGPKEKHSTKALLENTEKSKAIQKNTSIVSAYTGVRKNVDKKSQSSSEKSSKFRQESNPSSNRSIQSKAGSKSQTLPMNSARKNRDLKSGGKSGIYKTQKILLDESDRGVSLTENFGLDELIRASITAEYSSSDNFLPTDSLRNRNCSASSLNSEKISARKFCKPNFFTSGSKNTSEYRKGSGENSMKIASTKYKSRNYLKTESRDSELIPIERATRKF